MKSPLFASSLRAAAGRLDRIRRWCALRTIMVVLFGCAATALGLRAQNISTFATGLSRPRGLVFDTAGNLYVTNNNSAGTVSKVTPGGVVSTFATGIVYPEGLASDAAGNLYVADSNTLPGTVNMVTPGGVVSTFALIGAQPNQLAFDTAGNLYASNRGYNKVTKITPGGVASTFASVSSNPSGLAFDTAGNLYVTNYGAGTVSKVTPGGVVSLFASGFTNPAGLAFDTAGNLYVANNGSNTVSKVTPAGVVTLSFASGFTNPFGLAFDPAGNLYVTNFASTVSKVSFTPTVTTPTSTSVASTTALLGGNVTSDAGVPVTEIGVVYSLTATNSNPQIGGSGVTNVVGTGTTGVFTVGVTGLTAGSGYSYAAYAINGSGTSYSSVATFTTAAPPDITAPTVSSIVRQPPSTQSLTAGTTSATFRVTFSEAVNPPPTSNFAVLAVSSSIVGSVASVTSVGGSTSVYDIAVAVSSGDGEFRLKVLD